jgi:hypothetical protein
MASISITVDTKELDKAKLFVATISNQLPFATSVAINQTARDVQQALKAETSSSFANPVAYTRNAFRYTKSTKANLEAQVFADPTRRYFPTEIFGGTRRVKSYEAYLRGLSNGTLPPGKLLPTRTILNSAGNPKKAIFSTIANKLSTTDPGGVFIGTPKGGSRSAGVYRRSRGRLTAYFTLADSEPRYQARFPMERVGNATANRVFTSHLSKAIDRALASAR